MMFFQTVFREYYTTIQDQEPTGLVERPRIQEPSSEVYDRAPRINDSRCKTQD